MDRITINIGGMTCGHCVGAVKKALQSVEGVDVDQVSVGTATVSYDPNATTPERIAAAIEDEGYSIVHAAK